MMGDLFEFRHGGFGEVDRHYFGFLTVFYVYVGVYFVGM
jgi:hypothetical protein